MAPPWGVTGGPARGGRRTADTPVRHTATVGFPRRAEDFAFFANDGRPLAFAHRGGVVPGQPDGLENTLAAFHNAVQLGYRYLETDVHATRDGHVLAFHDARLDRLTDRMGRVLDVDYADLQSVRIGGSAGIPLLEEVLISWPQVRVNIDAKSDPAVAPLAAVIAACRAEDRVCVASFSARRLRALRRLLGPRVASSLSASAVAALRLLPGRRAAAAMGTSSGQAAQVPARRGPLDVVTRAFVERAHAMGTQVHVWTVNDEATMHRLLDLGVDGLISDRIDLLRDVLQERGQWAA